MKTENKVFLIGGIILLGMFLIIFINNFNTGICDDYIISCPIAEVTTICLIAGILLIGIALFYTSSKSKVVGK